MSKRKKIIIAAIIVGLLAIISTVSIVVVSQNNKKKDETTVAAPTKEKADDLKLKAVEAIKNKDDKLAKTLLEEAKKQYDAIGDTESSIAVASQLYFIEHPTTPPVTPNGQATPVNTAN